MFMSRKDTGDFSIYSTDSTLLICKFDTNWEVKWFKYYLQLPERNYKILDTNILRW